eukprot:Polyplicarium_translucidae@DN3708_c0_g1_i1.p1
MLACGGGRIADDARLAASQSYVVRGCDHIGICGCVDLGSWLGNMQELLGQTEGAAPLQRQVGPPFPDASPSFKSRATCTRPWWCWSTTMLASGRGSFVEKVNRNVQGQVCSSDSAPLSATRTPAPPALTPPFSSFRIVSGRYRVTASGISVAAVIPINAAKTAVFQGARATL